MRAVMAAISIAGMLSSISGAMASADQAYSLEILWSAPIIPRPSDDPRETTFSGFLVSAQTTTPDGRVVLLGDRIGSGASAQVLLYGAEQNQPDNAATLKLKGVARAPGHGILSPLFDPPHPTPYVSALASGTNGDLWVGGRSNTYRDMAGTPYSDAYLAKVDETGKPLWEMAYGAGKPVLEFAYGNRGRRNISSISPMSGGDAAVAGPDRLNENGWLARISADGKRLWELNIGNDLGSAVASLPDDRLAFAGFETEGSIQTGDYQVHVVTWIVDGSGKLLTQTRIRDSIHKFHQSSFGEIAVTAIGSAIYITSSWQDFFDAQPVEISKLSVDGKLLWTTRLTDTVVSIEGRRTWKKCLPALAVMPRGDALVACALNGQIRLYELEQSSGAYRESYFPLPGCQIAHPAALFLAVRPDGIITLSGTRPSGNVAPSCTWIGRLTAIR
jgi:hypothetical protein